MRPFQLYLIVVATAFLIASCADQKGLVSEELPEALIVQTSEASKENMVKQDQFGDNLIKVSPETGLFIITDKEGNSKIKDLVFAKSIGWEFVQIIDQKNTMTYLDADLQVVDKAQSFFGFCGTVPHYTMQIIKNEDEFIFTQDETFFDHEGAYPAEEIFHLSTTIADDVHWVNGAKTFNYDSNYGIGLSYPTDPNTIIYSKNGKWGLAQENKDVVIDHKLKAYSISEPIFDEILHDKGLLKTRLGNLFGYFGICEPIYSSLGPYENHLARFTKSNGNQGFIDTKGQEYLD